MHKPRYVDAGGEDVCRRVSKCLRAIREERGMTRDEVLSRMRDAGVHLTMNQMAELEAQAMKVSIPVLYALREIYGVRFDDLLGDPSLQAGTA